LTINVDSQGNLGLLKVSGTATLAGNLFVNNSPDYTPPLGTDLIFMTYGDISGGYDPGNVAIANALWDDPNMPGAVDTFFANEKGSTDSYDLVVGTAG